LHLAGRPKEAAAEAAEALRLDALNPHAEQKLKSQFVYDPKITAEGLTPSRGENAEQTMLGLRKTNGSENPP
jgi:hypothetical protein